VRAYEQAKERIKKQLKEKFGDRVLTEEGKEFVAYCLALAESASKGDAYAGFTLNRKPQLVGMMRDLLRDLGGLDLPKGTTAPSSWWTIHLRAMRKFFLKGGGEDEVLEVRSGSRERPQEGDG